MKRGGLGILVILIVALLVAFLVTSQMAGKRRIAGSDTEYTAITAVQEAQCIADAANQRLQDVISQTEGGT